MFPHPRTCLPSVLLTSKQGTCSRNSLRPVIVVGERGKKQSETAKKKQNWWAKWATQLTGEGKAWLLPFPLTRLLLGALPSIIFFAFFHQFRAWSHAIAKPEGPLLGAITPRFGLFQGMSLYMYSLMKVMARNWSTESDPEVEASLTEHFL